MLPGAPDESGPDQHVTELDPVHGSRPTTTSRDVEELRSDADQQQTPHQPYDQQVPPGYGDVGRGLGSDQPAR
jgi:hypothetical protein